MKRLLFAVAVLGAAYALAGTQSKDLSGAPPADLGPSPNAATLGVSLEGAVGCRMSVRVDAGTTAIGSDGLAASGWRLVPWYYDPSVGWVEGNSTLHASVEARLDGGRIRQFVPPDLIPAARFGRIFVSKFGVTGYDGGSGADWIADSGTGPQPVYRISCWGPTVVGN